MSSLPLDVAADICRPLAPRDSGADEMFAVATRKARQIMDDHPRMTVRELVRHAYLTGRSEACEDFLATLRGKPTEVTVYDNSTACVRCGAKVRLASSTPADVARGVVCDRCSTPDEIRS